MSTSPEQEIKEGSDSNIEENESIGKIICVDNILINWFLESAKTTSEKSKEENEKPKEKSDHVYLTLILVDSAKSHEFKISPKVNILAQSAEKFHCRSIISKPFSYL